VTLTAEQPYGEAAREIIGARAEAVFAARHGVLDTSDIERVHRMRVASRRLRAAMEVFAPAFERKRGRRALREVKALADALGERRDRDVALERLGALAGEVSGAERHAVDLLIEELYREQREANLVLAAALRHAKRTRLRARLRRLAR
jgi:CHAD domain-containing protein